MKYFEAEITINAKPETIWREITDIDGLTQWPSGITSLKGAIAPNGNIQLQAEAAPGRTFKINVIEFTPNKRMRWSSGMPFGLFKGVRTFTLTPQGDKTHFKMREEFTGAMLPMIWGSMPDLNPSFEKFVTGLKSRVENA